MLQLISKIHFNIGKYSPIFQNYRYLSSKDKGVPGLKIQTKKNILWIELDRTNKYNAITWEMYDGITDALIRANIEDEITATVMTGNGDYYSSGNDLTNFVRDVKTPADMKAMADKGERYLERFVRSHIKHEKPLISLVNGPAIGISVTVLALFDLVLASDRAHFHTPFSSLAQSPEGCSSYTFPMLMGSSKACEMLVFDRRLTANEAFERNLVTKVIPHERYHSETMAYVEQIAQLPPESLRLNKVLLRDIHRDMLLKVNVEECKLLKSRWLSKECQQRLNSFLTARKQ